MQIRTALAHLWPHRQIGQIDRQVRKSLNNPQNWPRPICLTIFRAGIGTDRSALTEDRKTTSPNCRPFFDACLSPRGPAPALGPPGDSLDGADGRTQVIEEEESEWTL